MLSKLIKLSQIQKIQKGVYLAVNLIFVSGILVYKTLLASLIVIAIIFLPVVLHEINSF